MTKNPNTGEVRLRSAAALKYVATSTAALLLGAAGSIGVASAQEDTTSASSGGETVMVTARRREEAAQSVPLSVAVVSSETLEDLGVSDIYSVSTLEPSLTVSASSGRPNHPVYSLRGIRPTEAIYGQDPTVAVYLADVVQSPSQGSNLGFYDVQNVQILKGPQGTLFGRNTVGGAILVTPRQPGHQFSADVMVGAGSFGLTELEYGVDLPVADNFSLRLAGRIVDSEGYQTNVVNGENLGGHQINSFRATALWDVTSSIQNMTMVYADGLDSNGLGATLEATNPTHSRAAANPAFFVDALARAEARNDPTLVESDTQQGDNVDAWGVTNTTTIDLSPDLTFKSILAYREVESLALIDLDSSSVPNILGGNQFSNLEYGSAEFQLLGTSFNDRLDWVAGLYYYSENGFESASAPFFGIVINQRGDIVNTSYSAFTQGSLALTDALTLTGGVRFNYDRRKLRRSQNVFGAVCLMRVDNGMGGLTSLPISNCAVSSSDEWEQPTGTISLDYQLNDDVLLYAATRLGYRSGGFNLRGDEPIEYAPFDPETVTDFEVGVKSDWTLGSWAMRTNVAVFTQKYSDIQRTIAVPTGGGTPGSVVVNAAEATTFGIELQQTIEPTDNLTFQINYAYNDGEYDEWVDNGVDVSDTPLFFTPEHSGSILVNYEQPLSGGENGALDYTLNAAYTGDQWINPLHTSQTIAMHPDSVLPLLQQEAYWVLDGSVAWKNIDGSNLDLTLYVRNLTDEEYKTGGVQLYTGATGFISATWGAPRSAGVQLRYHY